MSRIRIIFRTKYQHWYETCWLVPRVGEVVMLDDKPYMVMQLIHEFNNDHHPLTVNVKEVEIDA